MSPGITARAASVSAFFCVSVAASPSVFLPMFNRMFSVFSSLLVLFPFVPKCHVWVGGSELFRLSMCVCECVVVLGAGAETLCGEHVLMSTAVQYPAIPLFLLHTNTHTANFMRAQSSAPCTVCRRRGGTLFGIYMPVGVERTHGNKVGWRKNLLSYFIRGCVKGLVAIMANHISSSHAL